MRDTFRDLCVRLTYEWDHAPTSSDFMDFGGSGIIERIRAELSVEPIPPTRTQIEELVDAVQAAYAAWGEATEKETFELLEKATHMATNIEEGCDCGIEPLEPGNLKGIVEQAKSEAKRPPNGLAMQNASRILDAMRDCPPERIIPEASGGVRLYGFSLSGVSIVCDNDGEVFVFGHDR